MLKLRKVEIVGFKSFCERTVVTFSGSGTTCIVGPNGCGKSNVVDAISWVLGEQSHKSLRAERMADCIFNGTTKRPPLGMAEVTITMEDPELAEAARFVMECAANQADGDFNTEGSENAEKNATEGDSATATATDTADAAQLNQDAANADPGTESSEETGGKHKKLFKRKKKGEEKPVLATKPGEIMVSRRLYRSGQSEYLINGRVARLRDIQEMFMGVGLGPDSYAIIEQGRIGLILSTKPMERRAIIEEAAGVTKFKTKKRLAEAKLESSKVNLARVNDIVVEVEKQLGSLKRQAAKARRYSEIRDQMRGIVRQMLAGKARELDAAAERIAKQLEELNGAETQRSAAIQQMEGEQDRLNQRIYELDAEIRQNQNVLNLTALEVDRNENKIAFNRQRAQELAGRHAQMDAELKQARAQAAEWETRSATQVQAVTLLREESGVLNARVEELLQRAEQRAAQIRDAEGSIDALRRSASEASESLLQLHGEQKQAEEALSHQTEAQRKLEANEHEVLETSMRARDDAERAARELEAVSGQLSALKQSEAELQAKIGGLRGQRDGLTKEAGALRDSLAGVRARHSTLTQILNDRSYTAEAVQKLFAANERGGSQQFRGISMLRDEVGGRATFFVDSLRNLKLSNEYESIVNFHTDDGVISRMDKLVEFRDPLGAAAKQYLPRLRSAYLTDSSAAAEKLARDNPQYAFVTPDGTCYQGRMVTGGRPDQAGPLGMKRELRALNAEVLQLEHQMNEKQAALEKVAAELRATEQTLEETNAKLRETEREVFSAQHRHSNMQTELARLGAELAVCQNELARVRKEAENARGRAERAKHEHAAAALNRAEAETESVRLAEELVGLRSSVQTEQQELATGRAGLAAINERLAAAEALAARLREERAEMERRETAMQQQVMSISDETASLAKQSEELTQQLEGLRSEKLRLEARQKELEQEWESARTRVTQTEDHLRMGRQELQELREQKNHAEVERAKNESDREHLRETCVSEVNAQPEDLIATEVAFMSGEELATAEANYRDMKQRIENMGAVNMMALEEFNECEQRFAFLTRERDDLLKSIADTLQAIAELDQATKEKFEHAFHAINKSFSDAFHAIFGGGMAEMRLTEPDSSGDAGIDIVASPPGKRLQNVLLLSGGEKAMTALALLIAIFRYQPSPFCILDEVDAPLDEANVGRFTKLIGEMSDQTQFIVVTHNRKTMEIAPVLYGVTMQEPGVSKLVSVRWEETGSENPNTKSAAASAA